jgi:hypothetical protein
VEKPNFFPLLPQSLGRGVALIARRGQNRPTGRLYADEADSSNTMRELRQGLFGHHESAKLLGLVAA